MRNFFCTYVQGKGCCAGMGAPDQSLKDRLDYEIEAISTMGYVNYYLIVIGILSVMQKAWISP